MGRGQGEGADPWRHLQLYVWVRVIYRILEICKPYPKCLGDPFDAGEGEEGDGRQSTGAQYRERHSPKPSSRLVGQASRRCRHSS